MNNMCWLAEPKQGRPEARASPSPGLPRLPRFPRPLRVAPGLGSRSVPESPGASATSVTSVRKTLHHPSKQHVLKQAETSHGAQRDELRRPGLRREVKVEGRAHLSFCAPEAPAGVDGAGGALAAFCHLDAAQFRCHQPLKSIVFWFRPEWATCVAPQVPRHRSALARSSASPTVCEGAKWPQCSVT